ncbi:MAG: hemerythrin domain-containing protein [Pseudomonadota bacterium]
MIRTSNLRRQHETLLVLAKELKATAAKIETRDHAAAASTGLAKLTGLLRMHLVVEDRSLYPALLNCQDPQVAALAARFVTEMGGLGEDYFAFVDRWNCASVIFEQRDDFKSEYQAIFSALEARIEREKNELYPLADKIVLQSR